jgi:hypothetical protein
MRRQSERVAASIPTRRRNAVKCDVCDKEFNNLDELKQHMEQVHPMNEADVADDLDKENPEIKREMPEPEPAVVPDPTRR